jgi:signal transduction histidine kinase
VQGLLAHAAEARYALQVMPASRLPVVDLELPLERDSFVRTVLRHLAGKIRQRRVAEQTLAITQAVTAALSAARTPPEIARAVLEGGTAALGASTCVVFRRRDDHVEVLDQVGYAADVIARFRTMALDADLPAPEAIRTGDLVLVSSPDEITARYPAVSGLGGALAAIPLRAQDHVFGALGLGFAQPQRFTGSDIERLVTFAGLCAQAFERAESYEAATLANRRKDEFLAMLGHELRNPLAPIQTALDLMRMRDPTAFSREREVIERQTRHLTTLVDDMLDVTRIARGKFELRRSRMVLRDTVQRAIDVVEPALERRHHILDVVCPDELVLDADHGRLAQVLTNLLDNAAKYTDPGGRIALEVKRVGEGVRIEVRDDGRGIDGALLTRIFDPFEQDPRTGARTPGGLGLGLAIVKGIVELHGGRVEANSEGPGRGTEMVVWLPGLADQVVAMVSGEARTVPRPGVARILVVDDNCDAAEILALGLERLGFDARVAEDGPSALRVVEDFVPHVALIDLGMPLMDGFELCGRLRAMPALDGTRYIAVTGYGQPSDREATRAAGFDLHLVKPVTLPAVESAIVSLLRPPPAPPALVH